MRRLGLALLVVVVVLGGLARADGKKVAEVVGTFTANGTLDVKRKTVGLQLDYTAGTGTVSFTCRYGAGAPFVAFDATAAMTDCTADCVRPGAGNVVLPAATAISADCETLRLTMAACTGCNVVVYSVSQENRTQ